MVAASIRIAEAGHGKPFDPAVAGVFVAGFADFVAIAEQWREDRTS